MARFDFAAARKELRSKTTRLFETWRENPSLIEGKVVISREEISLIQRSLYDDFFWLVKQSPGLRNGQNVNSQDIALVRRILGAIQPLEDHFVADPQRRAWNLSCVEHSLQVGILARLLAERLWLDTKKMEVVGLIHDIGRFVSHHPLIHGLAGMELLGVLGFCEEYAIMSYSHLEAGASYLGATIENWEEIICSDNVQEEINSCPLPEIVIKIADMAKRGIEEPEGSGNFVNIFANPLEGTFVSGLRRLNDEQKRTVEHINPLDIQGKEQLLQIFHINREMGMYLGLCWFFMERVLKEGVVFEGNDGVIARAQERFNKMTQVSSS